MVGHELAVVDHGPHHNTVDVFRLDAVTAELAATAPWLIAATFALGAVLLFLYDELLRRFARLYRRRKRG